MENQLLYSRKYRLQYNLQLFAPDGPGGEKTEEATPKKLQDARKEGQVARSTDLVTACMLMGLFWGLKLFVGTIGVGLLEDFKLVYENISVVTSEEITSNWILSLIRSSMFRIVIITAPLMVIAFLLAFVLNVAQVKWEPTAKPLMPKLDKINPISGMKKLFSMDKVMELLKSIAKVAVLSYIVYDTLKDKFELLFQFYTYDLTTAIVSIGNIVIDLGIKVAAMFLIIAFADYLYQKYKFAKDMKMTKQEVKDEYKNSEGDPQIKGRIRAKMREASQKRMMQQLPEADVVITNPTHLAVALKYDKEKASAPIVIAKGADFLAQKIKEVARENNIEIVENKPVARMLYYNVDLEQEIPPELYQAVAEILAYVYGLKNS